MNELTTDESMITNSYP